MVIFGAKCGMCTGLVVILEGNTCRSGDVAQLVVYDYATLHSLIGLWLDCTASPLYDCSTTSFINPLNTTLLYLVA